MSLFTLGMMLKMSATHHFNSLMGMGSSGLSAKSSKYFMEILATTGEQEESIAVSCSCLKKFPWKEKTQFSNTYFSRLITSFLCKPTKFCSKVQLYIALASETSMCFVKRWLMTSKAVGAGILVKRADTSKETSSSSFLKYTDLRCWLNPLLSLTNIEVIPVYIWRILVRNLANWYVAVLHADTMGHIGS